MSDERRMSCEQLEERLSEWLDHDVEPATRMMLERHVVSCARCTALVSDLASIRREAASLPELVPSRDLWPGIEARIQAPVISLDQPRVMRPASARATRRRTWWVGAAAALITVTAGVTYYITIQGRPSATVAAAAPSAVRGNDTAAPMEVTQPAVELVAGTERSTGQRGVRPAGAGAPARSDVTEQSEYARDVAQLRAIVSQRRADFDSTTIAVLEKNLALIDRAIAESRAALQADPASEFLADQLARAMTKKVAILRTVALLPARS